MCVISVCCANGLLLNQIVQLHLHLCHQLYWHCVCNYLELAYILAFNMFDFTYGDEVIQRKAQATRRTVY
jgi:hypothetical protein